MPRSRSLSVRVRTLLSVGILLGFGTIGTAAYWTDDATVAVGSFQAGDIHLDLFSAVRLKQDSHQWATMTLPHMVPGSSRSQVVPVTNNSLGRLDLTYTVQGSAAGAIAPHLQVTLMRSGTSNGTTCTGGTLVGAANTPLATVPVTIGTRTPALAPGQSDQLCVQVRLAPTAPTAVQGASSAVTFEFIGTQTP